MRLTSVLFLLVTPRVTEAFIVPKSTASVTCTLGAVTEPPPIDCGCETVVYSGDPSEIAKNINIRERIRSEKFFRLNGESVIMDELIGTPSQGETAVVVMMRSLG